MRLWRWHWVGFLLQTVAYAANDGQKMLAVFMIAVGFTGALTMYTVLVAVLFGLGTLYGLPRAGRTLGREIIVSRPPHGVAAELAAGAAVIGCAAASMPVSMTQAIAGCPHRRGRLPGRRPGPLVRHRQDRHGLAADAPGQRAAGLGPGPAGQGIR